ncbi:MAG: hypothetical protein IPQ24_03135 [Anaeromyxobacter sp.]|nr:hypothetical protein [Anaeromyxobacter sp.]
MRTTAAPTPTAPSTSTPTPTAPSTPPSTSTSAPTSASASHPALTPAPTSTPHTRHRPTAPPQRPEGPAPLPSALHPRPPRGVVGVVASTGGPPALARLLSGLPASFPAAVLVVQHIAAGFETGLVHWLARHTPLGVKLAEHGEPLHGGVVYLAREGRHLTALIGTAYLDDAPPVRGFRPSGTALFHSLAREYGPGACGLVLTGMGDDGVDGLAAVRAKGGATWAQGPASSVVYGMPREAARRGAAAETLELDDLAPALVLRLMGDLPR